MSSIDIRHIVFDIGKVLIHYDPNLPYSRLIPDEAERNWFFRQYLHVRLEHRAGSRPLLEEAEALLIRNHPEREDHIRAFRRHWHEMVPHAYVGTVAIMEGLIADGLDVTMLTNFASDTFREAPEAYPFLTLRAGLRSPATCGSSSPISHLPDHAKAFDLDPGRRSSSTTAPPMSRARKRPAGTRFSSPAQKG